MKNRTVVLLVVAALVGLGVAKQWTKAAQAEDVAAAEPEAEGPPAPADAPAEEPAEEEGTPAERAIAKAKEAKLPMLLSFRSGVTQPGVCKPCIAMTEIVEQLRPKFEGKVALIDVSLDDDTTEMALIRQHKLRVKPTTILIGADGKVLETKLGVWPADALEARLKEVSK